MIYINSFWVGGLICVIAQILIDKTKFTPARILVLFVILGAVLGALGIYKPLLEFAGAGAAVPISGFGYNLSEGVINAVDEKGFLGIFTGGLTQNSGGLTAAITFGLLASLIFTPKQK